MNQKKHRLAAAVLSAALFCISAQAEDMRKLISLAGSWKFSIGDDISWASPLYDDSRWDQLNVPGTWESQGYNEYNGYAWYRKAFKVEDLPDNVPVYLILGQIDDADVVYLNGRVLGRSGKFPPDFLTAYDKLRKYAIPSGYLKENAVNVIAVQVYDTYLEGGIMHGPTGIYTDADIEYLRLNLSGKWKFHTGDNPEWKTSGYNDAGWKTIQVPSEWENQGYNDYDGYAWYRFSFKLPQGFRSGEYYLSLGKIDDMDQVYLNGRLVGSVQDLKKDGEYRRSGWEYNARRLYRIQEGWLNMTGVNTLAVRVYDGQLRGGIYEGPIGLMTVENYKRYRNKHHSNQSFWDYIYDTYFWD